MASLEGSCAGLRWWDCFQKWVSAIASWVKNKNFLLLLLFLFFAFFAENAVAVHIWIYSMHSALLVFLCACVSLCVCVCVFPPLSFQTNEQAPEINSLWILLIFDADETRPVNSKKGLECTSLVPVVLLRMDLCSYARVMRSTSAFGDFMMLANGWYSFDHHSV